jgi:hypothetical protein
VVSTRRGGSICFQAQSIHLSPFACSQRPLSRSVMDSDATRTCQSIAVSDSRCQTDSRIRACYVEVYPGNLGSWFRPSRFSRPPLSYMAAKFCKQVYMDVLKCPVMPVATCFRSDVLALVYNAVTGCLFSSTLRIIGESARGIRT